MLESRKPYNRTYKREDAAYSAGYSSFNPPPATELNSTKLATY
jgi:hypothetical protein